jgi:hypothetical protein
LRNASLCKDFIKAGGLDLILGIPDLASVPIRFASTSTAAAISSTLRVMAETDHAQLVTKLVQSAEASAMKVKPLWDDATNHEQWTVLGSSEGNGLQDIAGLNARLYLLSEILVTLAYSNAKIITTLIQAINSSPTFIAVMGQLQRASLIELEVLKAVPDKAATKNEPTPLAETETDVEPASVVDVALPAESGDASVLTAALTGADEPAASPTPAAWSKIQYLATRMHEGLLKVFKGRWPSTMLTQACIKLLFIKRSPEASHKLESTALADSIADVLIGHLQNETTNVDSISTVAVGLTTIMLFDGRSRRESADHRTSP